LATEYQREGVPLRLTIPIEQENRFIGVLVLASRQESIPQPVLSYLQSLAVQAASAMVRIQTEGARAESERRFRALAEASFEGVAVSKNGRIVDCNEQLTRIVGYTREELIGSDLFRFVPLELTERTRRRIEEGKDVSTEVEIVGKNGQKRVVEIRGRSPEGAGGPRLTTVRDITERVRLEREILEIGDRTQVTLGQEIHDGLSQVLVSAAFDANALAQAIREVAPAEQPALERLCRALDNAITDTRRLARGLFPVKLERQGLTTSLRHLTESVGQSAKLETRFREVGGPILISDNLVTIHLFRIAQEALNNAVKHARARRLEVRLTDDCGFLTLEVIDDGVGIAPEAQAGPGLGLHIMQYRAHALGATLQANARPGGGTEVICRLPWLRAKPGPEAS
jgi:PAS domain S-box-containing protein